MKKKTEICIYDSTMIHSSTYNFETGELRVEFKGGTIYQFNSVLLEDYVSFSSSESIGKAFNEFIRPYTGQKLVESKNLVSVKE